MTKEEIKAIALFKANNPTSSIKEIAAMFNKKPHQVRYAIDKYTDAAKLLKGNRSGRVQASKMIAKNISDIVLFNKQLGFVISALDNDDKMPLKTRIDYLYKITKMKTFVQEVELESHLKRVDAAIIGGIIKRFLPDATNEDVINIYNEELHKWQNSKK